jgi:molybdate transport system permease protein
MSEEARRRARANWFRYLVLSGLFLSVGAIVITFLAMATYIDAPTFASVVFSADTAHSVRLTAVTTTITTAIAVLLAVPAGYALSRYRLPFHALIDTLVDLPIVLPPLIGGIALLVFFQTPVGVWITKHIAPFAFETRGIVLAQLVPAGPFCVRALKAAYDSVNPRMEQVARTLGCNERQAFFRVVLPQARNGLVAGAVMTWARAAGEFGPILMFCMATKGKTDVLPIAAFLHMSSGEVEMALGVTLILVMVATVALLLFKRLGGRGYFT